MNKRRRYSTRWLTPVIARAITTLTILATVLPVAGQAEGDDTTPVEPVVVPPVTPAEVERLIGGMPRITLQLEDTPLEEVLAQLNRQGGIELQFDMRYRPVDLKQVVSFNVQDMLLWEAAQALEDQMRGQLIFVQDGVVLRGTYFKENLAPQGIRGPLFFLNPSAITREAKATRVFATDEVTGQENFSLSGFLMVDPRFRCISGPIMRIAEMVDEKGGSLLGDVREFNGSSGSAGARNFMQFKVDLKSRPDMGQRIVRIKGVVSTLFAAQSETWEINDPRNAAGATRTVRTNLGDMTYSLDGVLQTGNTCRFSFVITGPVLGVFDDQPAPSLGTIIAAYDANGKVINSPGSSNNVSLTHSRESSVYFNQDDPAGLPAKFVLTLPLDIRRLEIPFELKDLPLPSDETTAPATAVAMAPEKPDEAPSLTLEEAVQRMGKSPLVTLHFKSTNAAEVVAELARQSGIEIAFSRDPDRMAAIPTISVDVEQQPFWDALRAVLAACKLRFAYKVYGSGVIGIILESGLLGTGAAAQWQGPVGASGLARIRATRCDREQYAQISFAPERSAVSQSLRLSCEVALPPQLAVMPYSSKVRVDEALDEKGNSLRPTLEIEAMNPTPPYGASVKLDRDILLLPRAGSQWLAQLKGAISFDAATRRVTWEIPDCLKAKQLTRKSSMVYNGRTYEQTCTLDNFVLTAEDFKFTMRIVNEPPQPPPAQEAGAIMRSLGVSEFFRHHIQLRDEDGQLFPEMSYAITGAGADSPIAVRFYRRVQFYNLGAPATLTLELPTEIQRVEIPFEFKDVPLP